MRSAVHLAIALAAAAFAPQPSAAEPAQASEEWFLSEFDWGDSRPLVDESARVAPAFRCAMLANRCAAVSADVDGEELAVRFAYYKGLYRIRVGTPPLPGDSRHLPRLWQHLVDFLTREKGPPESAKAFPDLGDVRLMSPVVTHLWRLPDQEIRIVVDREKARYRVAAIFMDPVRAAERKQARQRAAREATAGEAAREAAASEAAGAKP
jgi:hypothetical protein